VSAEAASLQFDRFCVFSRAAARCLTAVVPDFCDMLFGRVARQMLDGAPSDVDEDATEGVWLRSPGERPGYIFIGPSGGQHFYTRDKPAGIDDAQMKLQSEVPPGRLIGQIRAMVMDAERLTAGEPVAARSHDGAATQIAAPSGAAAKAAEARGQLQNALWVAEDRTAAGALRRSMGRYLEAFATVPAAEAASSASQDIVTMREACAADARLTTLALLRPALARALPSDGSQSGLIAKSFESLGAGGDPERMTGKVVRDYAAAGQATLLTAWLDATILGLRDDVKAAKNASTIDSHGTALYRMAAAGYAARSVADVLRNGVAPSLWPSGISSEILDHYIGQAEEKVVRASHALVIAAINAGSGLALVRHRAAVKAEGLAKAKELIDEYYFYPSRDLNLLTDP
jgi:hypothetical protein